VSLPSFTLSRRGTAIDWKPIVLGKSACSGALRLKEAATRERHLCVSGSAFALLCGCPLSWKGEPQQVLQTRRAAHMDVRRFSTEPWRASRKIPSAMKRLDCFVGEGTFFWLLFLVPAKKSDSRIARKLCTSKRKSLGSRLRGSDEQGRNKNGSQLALG